jgi:hypothetical protein
VSHPRRPEYSTNVSHQDGTSQQLHNNKGDEQLKGLQTVTVLNCYVYSNSAAFCSYNQCVSLTIATALFAIR